MKFVLNHRHHDPSPAFVALVREQIEMLAASIKIDEARVIVERRDGSPAFRVSTHLVTPGVDVLADATDHTLRAALQKAIAELEDRIDARHAKRKRRVPSPRRVAARTPRLAVGMN